MTSVNDSNNKIKEEGMFYMSYLLCDEIGQENR